MRSVRFKRQRKLAIFQIYEFRSILSINEDRCYQLLSFDRKGRLDCIFESQNVGFFLFIILAIKWELSSEHSVQSDSKGPNIRQLGFITSFSDDLRWSVGRSATDGLSELSWKSTAAEAEVNEFYIPVFVKEDIFRFYVPMAEVILLQVK